RASFFRWSSLLHSLSAVALSFLVHGPTDFSVVFGGNPTPGFEEIRPGFVLSARRTQRGDGTQAHTVMRYSTLRVARRHLLSRGLDLHDSSANNCLRGEAKAIPDPFFWKGRPRWYELARADIPMS